MASRISLSTSPIRRLIGVAASSRGANQRGDESSSEPSANHRYYGRIDPERFTAPKQNDGAVNLLGGKARNIQELRSQWLDRSPDHFRHQTTALYHLATHVRVDIDETKIPE